MNVAAESSKLRTARVKERKVSLGLLLRLGIGLLVLAFFAYRFYGVLARQAYGAETWARLAISGLIIGSVYAVIALGYTLVYGILFMINFAHGEVMMIGAFAGYFVLEAFAASGFSARQPVLAILLTFLAGMTVSMLVGISLERIAYRPLRGAPRLVPLISAIGASIFLQNAAQLMFGSMRRTYSNPPILERNVGWVLDVAGKPVSITYTGVLTFAFSVVLMIGLYLLVQRTRLGRAMRAVAENKEAAALMGVDVDRVIANTFAISGVLAGAAGVMWGLHNGIIYHYVGFIPGLKAFTAAVLGGIGNIPGAMLGGIVLGIAESLAPAVLDMPFQLKDVLAFAVLVLVLIFRPTGILGEVLAEEKV
jgi:branched-chain amino acid transport system permease protein